MFEIIKLLQRILTLQQAQAITLNKLAAGQDSLLNVEEKNQSILQQILDVDKKILAALTPEPEVVAIDVKPGIPETN